jgi:hypothetical protein
MTQSPVGISIVAGVVLLIFGPKKPGWPLAPKPETNEPNKNSPRDPFPKKIVDLFIARIKPH